MTHHAGLFDHDGQFFAHGLGPYLINEPASCLLARVGHDRVDRRN